MTKVVSHQIHGDGVIDHFASTLETGGKGAQEHFIKVADQGDFFALAPEDATEDRLNQFRTGGLFPHETAYERGRYRIVEVPYHADMLVPIVREHARNLQQPMVLLHEPYLTLNDPSEITRELTKIDSALYKLLLPTDVQNADLVREIGRFTVSWHALVILLEHQEPHEITHIIQSAKLMAVGAYKGESYVYWVRHNAGQKLPS